MTEWIGIYETMDYDFVYAGKVIKPTATEALVSIMSFHDYKGIPGAPFDFTDEKDLTDFLNTSDCACWYMDELWLFGINELRTVRFKNGNCGYLHVVPTTIFKTLYDLSNALPEGCVARDAFKRLFKGVVDDNERE